MTTPELFTPLTLGGKKNPIQLLHRVVMAPLTRSRTGEEGVQKPMSVEYYKQRATSGGLIIAEATNISPTARGAWGSSGIFTPEQIEAWRNVTQAVHDKGGKMFLQLWHMGRISHPLNQPGGILPVSSSSKMENIRAGKKIRTPEGLKEPVPARTLDASEIPGIVADYRKAAENAIAAGFDGVELHGANGYLLEQFLHDGINDRTDQYGGSPENRARFLFEALEAILKGSARQFRATYKGVLIAASGFDRQSAVQIVDEGAADAVAIGRYFISNPDLVRRLQLNKPLTDFNVDTFYLGDEHGYTDYPFLSDGGDF